MGGGVWEPRPGTRGAGDGACRCRHPTCCTTYFPAKPAGRCTFDLTTMIDAEQWPGGPAVAADLGSDPDA
jgi:hypothetical protein